MNKIDLDKLFLLSSLGNRESYEDLYNWFIHQGMILAKAIAKQNSVYSFNEEETLYQLAILFLETIRSYRSTKSPFEKYAMFLLKRRCTKIVLKTSIENDQGVLSLDYDLGNGNTLYDLLESTDYLETEKGLYMDERKQLISSTNIKNRKLDRKIRKLVQLKELGYKKKDIMKIMDLTDGQYRYLSRTLYDFEHGRLEIDLK